MPLTTLSWWQAAGRRAAYTALAALVPLIGLLLAGETTPLFAASTAGLAALVSLVWSIKGLPEVDGEAVPAWKAILTRVLKTAAQVAAPALANVGLLEDVGWHELGVAVGGAAAVTLLRTLMTYLGDGLPEDPGAPVHRKHVHGEWFDPAVLPEADATPPPPENEPRY